MFKQLKAAIAECHVKSDDKIFATFFATSEDFLFSRSKEALMRAQAGEDVEKNLIFATRLMNLIRVKRKVKELAETKVSNENSGS